MKFFSFAFGFSTFDGGSRFYDYFFSFSVSYMEWSRCVSRLADNVVEFNMTALVQSLDEILPVLKEKCVTLNDSAQFLRVIESAFDIFHLIHDYGLRQRFQLIISAILVMMSENKKFEQSVAETWGRICENILTHWDRYIGGIDFDSSRFIFRLTRVLPTEPAVMELCMRTVAQCSIPLLLSVHFEAVFSDFIFLFSSDPSGLLSDLLAQKTIPTSAPTVISIGRILDIGTKIENNIEKKISTYIGYRVLNICKSDLHTLLGLSLLQKPPSGEQYASVKDPVVRAVLGSKMLVFPPSFVEDSIEIFASLPRIDHHCVAASLNRYAALIGACLPAEYPEPVLSDLASKHVDVFTSIFTGLKKKDETIENIMIRKIPFNPKFCATIIPSVEMKIGTDNWKYFLNDTRVIPFLKSHQNFISEAIFVVENMAAFVSQFHDDDLLLKSVASNTNLLSRLAEHMDEKICLKYMSPSLLLLSLVKGGKKVSSSLISKYLKNIDLKTFRFSEMNQYLSFEQRMQIIELSRL